MSSSIDYGLISSDDHIIEPPDVWEGRLEAKFPINRANLGIDNVVYLRGDAEVFVPLGDDAPETFGNRWRMRLGGGYRFSFPWRIEVLGIWQRSRNTLEDDFGTTQFMLDLRLRHYFQ